MTCPEAAGLVTGIKSSYFIKLRVEQDLSPTADTHLADTTLFHGSRITFPATHSSLYWRVTALPAPSPSSAISPRVHSSRV